VFSDKNKNTFDSNKTIPIDTARNLVAKDKYEHLDENISFQKIGSSICNIYIYEFYQKDLYSAPDFNSTTVLHSASQHMKGTGIAQSLNLNLD
jgi:hypothetical protein